MLPLYQAMSTIDKVRDYWNRRPCNIRHSPEAPGSRAFFDDVAERKYYVEPHIPGFADFWRHRESRVLEVGCGLATDTMNFARMGCKVTAVDISEESLALAAERAKVYSLQEWITFRYANAEHLSDYITPEPYELIYAFGSIHHSPDPARIVRELHKFTCPGTVLKVMVYNKFSWKVLWMLLAYGYRPNFIAEYSEAEMGCPVTYAYSKAEAKKLIEQGGFKVMDIKIDHIFPYSIPEYRNYEYKKVWYFRWIPHTWFRWLEQRFGWQMLITAVAE